MFDNISERIKKLANIILCTGIICSVILGLMLLTSTGELVIIGLLVMIIGTLLSYGTSCFVYGFAEIIEETAKIEVNTFYIKEWIKSSKNDFQ